MLYGDLTTMNRRDWTLLVIGEAGLEPLQPVQLQKALFLIGSNLSRRDLNAAPFYRFKAYDYGPFCADVYSDAESLEGEDLVAITRPPDSPFKLYRVTPRGAGRAEELRGKLTERAREYLGRVVRFTQERSFNQLVGAIYAAYPEMKSRSVFRTSK